MYKLIDNRNGLGPYFVFVARSTQITHANRSNIATFLTPNMHVTPLRTSRFQTDITPQHDDFMVAVFSLLLLLAIQGILTSIILRRVSTRAGPGSVSTFGFSLAHALHLARDYRPLQAFISRGKHPQGQHTATLPRPSHRHRHINRRLAVSALVLLLLTFGLEFLILFYSSPGLVAVSNGVASLGLKQPVLPRWGAVRAATQQASAAPCGVVLFEGVDQRRTRVTTCVSSTVPSTDREIFKPIPSGNQSITIHSDLHDYGAVHRLIIDGQSANYSSMAYFRLEDGRGCILPERTRKRNRFPSMRLAHKTLIGFLASAYNLDTGEQRFDVDVLRNLELEHENVNGPDIEVLKLNKVERFLRVVSDRYTTTGTIPAIGAGPALSFAHTVFKAMSGVEVTGPATVDLFQGSGSKNEHPTIVWYEHGRLLNWLTLLVVLSSTMIVLFALRVLLRPASTADIAGLFVKQGVGATNERSPVQGQGEKEDLDLFSFTDEELGIDSSSHGRQEEEENDDYDTLRSKEFASWARSGTDLNSLPSQSEDA